MTVKAEHERAVGVVAIGRNEGERLRACLESVCGLADTVVYVDSASGDGSVELARSMGVAVVELDMSRPFSAARARNEGFAELRSLAADVPFVQFIDGDCGVADGWLNAATDALIANPDVAVVCGRRRERHPDASIYNRLCDIEWDTPIGEANACGGDALMRVAAVTEAGGYDPSVIAAEDDELCVRIRRAGWKVLRIDHDMTWHDAAMSRPQQWWKRAVRAGHGFAQGAAMHGAPPERHFVHQLRSCLVWGALAPLVALALAYPTRGLSLLALATLYSLMIARVARHPRYADLRPTHAWLYAVNCVAAKAPACVGAAKYLYNRLTGADNRIIEYK